jgi:hypothetical protein
VSIPKAAFLASGLLIGASAGYFIGVQRARAEFNKKLETEVAQTISEFKATYQPAKEPLVEEESDSEPTPEEKGHTGASFVKPVPGDSDRPRIDYAAKSKKPKPQKLELPNNSITPGINVILNDPDIGEDPMKWDRSPDRPYVISVVEFMENGKGEGSQTLRYWSDGVMTDDVDYRKGQDLGTYNQGRIDEMVGLSNLKHFGKGSQSDDILYVRNEKINMDYEIELRDESYSETVLGISSHDFADGIDF